MSYNHNLIKDIAILNLLGDTTGTAAATTGSPGVVDMQGFTGCLFLAISATTSWGTAQDFFVTEGATTSAFVSLAAGGATAYTTAATSTSAQYICVDVFRPKDRYIQANIDATIGGIYAVHALKYTGRKSPITQSTAYTPDTGTAYVATPST